MKTATTTAAQLEEAGRRLDASYHASDGVRAYQFIHKWAGQTTLPQPAVRGVTKERAPTYSKRRLDTLAEVCVPGGVFIPGRFKRIYVDDPAHGAPYLTGGSIMQADPLAGAKLLSYRHTANMNELALHERMILITCSGTIGNCMYVNANFKGAVGSPDLIRIIANPQQILSGYLYAWLSSPLARALIEQKTYGAVIPHIEAHHVVDLPVPRLDAATEQRVHELIEQAATLWSNAQNKIVEAHEPFSYLNTENVRCYFPHNRGCSVVQCSELNDRLGAHYHSAVYRRLEERIRTDPYLELGQLSRRIFAPPPFKHIYLSEPNHYPFVTGGELVNRRFLQVRYLSKHGVKDINEYVVRGGWLAIYKSGQLDSMLGTAFYIPQRLDGLCLSDHVIRVLIDEKQIDPMYVYAFLSTWPGRLLVIRRAMGKSVPFVREEAVSTIPIPLLSQGQQAEIGKLVRIAFSMQTESLDLEDQAQTILGEELAIGRAA